MKSHDDGFGLVGIVMIIIFALALVAAGYFMGHKGPPQIGNEIVQVTPTTGVNLAPSPTTVVTPLVSSAPATSTTVATGVTGQMRFTSPAAGISFLFATSANGGTYGVKEVGDTIYVYDTKFPYTQGQYVKVFPKSPTDTLDQAIQKALLTGIEPKDCYVAAKQSDPNVKYPATYAFRTLNYPTDPNSDVPAFAQTNKCPAAYAATNGISYFLGDSAHPKTFLFFSIGQYGIDSAPNSQTMWQDTVEFLN